MSSTVPPASRAAGRGRRRTRRAPGIVAMGRSSCRSPTARPSGRGRASPRSTAPAWSVPVWSLAGTPSSGGQASWGRRPGSAAGPSSTTRRRSVEETRSGPGSWVATSTWPRRTASRSTPVRLSATRPPRGPSGTAASWTSRPRIRATRSPGRRSTRCPMVSGRPREVPVMTRPRPRTAKTRSTASHAPAASCGRVLDDRSPGGSMASRRVAKAARSASRPAPPTAETATMGTPERLVPARRSATSAATSARRDADTRSAFVSATMPRAMPIAWSRPRCSNVWARGPSSTATTRSAASISPTPTSMLPMSLSCPGTSTKSISGPPSGEPWAYPTSMVRPRRFSSGRRSASMPVSARNSVVLPWSMCPAVPTTTVTPRRPRAPGPAHLPAPRRRPGPRHAGRRGPRRPRCAR